MAVGIDPAARVARRQARADRPQTVARDRRATTVIAEIAEIAETAVIGRIAATGEIAAIDRRAPR